MADVLRLLAIHVAEPDPGAFEWVITERVNDQWKEIDRAEDVFETYQTAMARGLVALEAMISNLDVGPRRDLEQNDTPQARAGGKAQPAPSDAGDDSGPPQAKPKKAAYFGFGPIR